jgi:DNA invertase Pin-like site-specific DNA recombinase
MASLAMRGSTFAIAAEIERDLISQRTTEALQARKQRGMPLGRPKGVGKSKLDDHRAEIEALLKNGSTKIWVANKYQTTVGNLRHWMKQHGITVK